MSEPSWPEVVRRMIDTGNNAVEFAPLGENLLRAQQTKRGTQITLGVPGARVTALMHGSYVGGLLLIRKDEYDRVLAELTRVEPDAPGADRGADDPALSASEED